MEEEVQLSNSNLYIYNHIPSYDKLGNLRLNENDNSRIQRMTWDNDLVDLSTIIFQNISTGNHESSEILLKPKRYYIISQIESSDGQLTIRIKYIDSNGEYVLSNYYTVNTINSNIYSDITVTDELFTSDYDTSVKLINSNLISGTVNVTSNDGSTTYTENTDYTINYVNGSITVLSSGSMSDSTNYLIDYDHRIWPCNAVVFDYFGFHSIKIILETIDNTELYKMLLG